MGGYDIQPCYCPFCLCEADAEYVDVGVGLVQASPYQCSNCGAHESRDESATCDPHNGWEIPNGFGTQWKMKHMTVHPTNGTLIP